MAGHRPRVSIGLPVFNGENYLAEALDSLLAQTHTDLELIISDNASTDSTQEICLAYAARDPRIRYYRNDQNVGAAGNFNRVFELSSGEYFKWAAHDDLIAPSFLENCVRVLDCNPDVVLCHSKVRFISDTGAVIADYYVEMKKVDSVRPQDRFGELIMMHHWCFDVFGLIRADCLRRTSLIASYIGSDRNLLVELGLLGRLYAIPEYLFFSRDHATRSIAALPLHGRAQWFDTANRGRLAFPRWSLFSAYIRAVVRSPLSRHERFWCWMHLGKWLAVHGKGLVKDLMIAFYQLITRSIPRTREEKLRLGKDNLGETS